MVGEVVHQDLKEGVVEVVVVQHQVQEEGEVVGELDQMMVGVEEVPFLCLVLLPQPLASLVCWNQEVMVLSKDQGQHCRIKHLRVNLTKY